MFSWKKKGLVFEPAMHRHHDWLYEFAQCTSTLVFDDFVRVYFSTRPPKDENGQCVSVTAFVDLDRKNLKKILRVADKPVLPLGELGTFDEFGVYPTCVLRRGENVYFYYAGWTRLVSVFANVAIGVAVGDRRGEKFQRLGQGPIMTRTLNEPFVISGPKVREFDSKLYMFYLAGERWVLNAEGKSEAIYKIRSATSNDGINWVRSGKNIIDDLLEPNECQAGPDVFYFQGKYHMYFSYRFGLDFRGNNRGYRIGYAWSTNLIDWKRDDENVGISLSDSGWDSQDMHYPHIFELDGKFYMLYNGNEFGKAGFGLAEMEKTI